MFESLEYSRKNKEKIMAKVKFFDLYNIAAKKDGKAPLFSKKSIQFIKKLEQKYSLSP
jgi:sRNA-binding regulator protein Hfq